MEHDYIETGKQETAAQILDGSKDFFLLCGFFRSYKKHLRFEHGEAD